MKKKYKKEMDYVYAVINEMDRKLDRPIRDLDDVRMIMETLGKIREQEVDMELRIDPIEVGYPVGDLGCFRGIILSGCTDYLFFNLYLRLMKLISFY